MIFRGELIYEEKYFNSNCFESYSNLDNYGRCGVAFANLGKDTMPKGHLLAI